VIIAIDGPSGSGKSTTAREIAKRTGFLYLDTGAMYRSVALLFLDTETEVSASAARATLSHLDLDIRHEAGTMKIVLSGRDVTGLIRSAAVTDMSSKVSTLPIVRERMVSEQRRIAKSVSDSGGSVIVEGRDIGSIVFPDADLKIFLDADPSIRAQRRHEEIAESGQESELSHVLREMGERDDRDRTRAMSPLIAAKDAIVVDTSRMTFDQQVDLIVNRIRERT